MSRRKPESQGVWIRVVAGIAFVIAAGALGSWLGAKTSPTNKPKDTTKEESPPEQVSAAAPAERQRIEPPLYFYGTIQPGSDIEAVAAEVKMAAAAGIHDYILRMQFPWPEQGQDVNAALYPLDRIEQEDPKASIVLAISLNPPETWFAEHPAARASSDTGQSRLPSVSSDEWLVACRAALSSLMEQIENSERGAHVDGLLLGALEDDRWFRSGDYDRSAANTEAFRAWLRNAYSEEAALREAWGDPNASSDSVEIPTKPNNSDQTKVFFSYPQEQNQIDYLRFVSESTADAIGSLSGHIHQTSQRFLKLYVPYGASFELAANDAGQCALGLLLDGEIDGFVSPVSYQDRGLGGAGGFMGPVNSASYHSRQWIVVDDTRTGITRNATTGAADRIEGLRTEDVLGVQKRNFASALTNGIGLAWADAQGTGALYEPHLWDAYKKMRDVYDATWNDPDAPGRGEFITYPTPEKRVTLMVVVDESSRFYQRCDAKLNELLLQRSRDAALHAGVPTQFCLLQDVLDGHAAPASVYLFVNAFHLHPEDRDHLHNIMIANKSAAIWLYAPGYLAEKADAKNVATTTGLKVSAFEKPAVSGSSYQLTGGKWLKKGQEFGKSETWSPLFYIDAPESKVLAKYRDSGKPSVAVEFLDEGWASIFVAEPTLSDELLREILLILENNIIFRKGASEHTDVAYFGPGFVALHASADGEHTINFHDPYDAQDVLDPSSGWSNKLYITVPMKTGETRILRLKSAVSDELPEPSQGDEVTASDDDKDKK